MDSSDADNHPLPTSALATAFLALREAVLAQWSARVMAGIPSAQRLGAPALAAAMPLLYDHIAHALQAGAPGAFAAAREQATLSDYGPDELIHELQIFRDVLFAAAGARGLALSKRDAELIGRSIEDAERDAIHGYDAVGRQAKETFIAALSHDLRNPLHVASASAQLIQLKTSDPGITNLAKRISAKLAETDAMIQSLLDAAVSEARQKLTLQLAQVDIMALIEEVCGDLPMVGQRVRVEGDAVKGWWCRGSLKRVLENLVSNARKYGDSAQAITVTVSQADGSMLLAVHNEGRPIPAADLRRMCRGFQRIEDVRVKGWELGLPYVQAVAESHGGSLAVDSAEGRGTTFTVKVPVDARPHVGS
ncbi:HAMP domain-containing histidine kinase [Massilia sp. G4R7]|uniref:histidine kinase n=1 Tax=Massilia phyllostachyos TaxID=2898585 RepID=A0ABS8QBN8_9BURK|nr:HAMP domain-containing sensor histidine kinase [Massilia phyllostachyos]MCD2519162.1 HAMP domain-containing histidine kinase [Massilia phyllostachyos]